MFPLRIDTGQITFTNILFAIASRMAEFNCQSLDT